MHWSKLNLNISDKIDNNISFLKGDGESSAARAAEARRRAAARRKAKNQHIKSSQLRLGTPPPVQGRKHERIQTENYLEEIFVHPPVAEICTQTDLFLERPVSPFYVPAKTGADASTQIYPGDVSNEIKIWKNISLVAIIKHPLLSFITQSSIKTT